MRKLLLFAFATIISASLMAQIEGTWKVANEAGAIGVGPGQGDISWWSNSADDLTLRACYFDDEYVFGEDGSFMNVMGDETWLEVWQGVEADGCGAPIAPHDGSNAATWTWDGDAGELTLDGVGAFLGLAKVYNGGELTAPGDAPESITYLVEFSEDNSRITVDIAVAGDGWWRFKLDKVPPAGPTARVQVIHNSADAAAAVVDVWLNDILLLDDFAFRTASPFVDAPAGEEFTIAIQGPDSQGPENPIWSQNYTLEDGETYILVADGIVSESGYEPNQPFDIAVYGMGREAASMMENTDVLVHHGSTDAPTVDVYETGVGAGEIVNDLMYMDFAGYLELGTMDYVLEVRDETGVNTVAAYAAPLATLGLDGAAITVVASGFLNTDNNSNGPAFGLWVALASGGELVELPEPASIPLTMNVDMTDVEGFDPAIHSVYVSGNIFGWPEPGTNPDLMLTQVDETLIYTISANLTEAQEVQYKYFSDVVAGGWDGGEWTGDPNRTVYITGETTLDDMWGDQPSVVTFMVDMSWAADTVFNVETDEVYMAGTINVPNGWVMPGESANMKMMPVEEGSMMYSLNVTLYNGDYEYKYFLVRNGMPTWDLGEWEGGDNRAVTVDTTMAVEDYWASLTGTFEAPKVATFNIYPNPANSVLHIVDMDNATEVKIFNVVGSLIKTVEVGSANTTINVSDLTKGVYFVSVYNAEGVQTSKFIKE